MRRKFAGGCSDLAPVNYFAAPLLFELRIANSWINNCVMSTTIDDLFCREHAVGTDDVADAYDLTTREALAYAKDLGVSRVANVYAWTRPDVEALEDARAEEESVEEEDETEEDEEDELEAEEDDEEPDDEDEEE